jgi:hypothetical protein
MFRRQSSPTAPATISPPPYTIVFTLAILSGAHYVFFVSKLLNEDRRDEDKALKKSDKDALRYYISERSRRVHHRTTERGSRSGPEC